MNMPTTRTLSRLLPALVILAVVAVGTMGAGAVSPDTVAQTESPSTADASSPNAYDYVDETGVVTTDGLLAAIDDFRRDDISTETLLDVLESFRSGTPLAGFEFTDQPVTQTNGTITVTDLEAPGGEGLTTDHLVVFNGATTDADAIVGSVQLESLEGVTPNQSVVTRDRVDIPIDNRSMDESGNYTVALHASTDGDPNPAVVRPGTVQTASVTVAMDGTVLEFREVNGEVTDDPVTEGEELTAYAAIENVGAENKTKTATFRVNGDPIDTRTHTIAPGEREKLLFTYRTESGDSPSVSASLALGETETATTTAEVRRSSEFVVNIEDITDPVLATGNVTRDLTAEVRVENLGGGTGTLTRSISLSVNGIDTPTPSKEVELDDGETTRIDLSGNGIKVTESETSVTAAVDTSGGDSSDRIVTLRGPVKNIDTGETFERLQPAVDGSGEADTIRIDDNLTGGETAANPPPDSTLNPTVDIDTDRLTVTTDGAERSINASLSTTEVLDVTGDNVTIDGMDKSLTTIKGNVTITGDNNTIRDVTIVGNLILDGADTSTSNVDVISGEIVTNVPTTAQTPSDGNIIINGANSAVDGVSTEGDIVIDASDVTVTDSSAATVTVTSNGNNANVNNVDASEFDVAQGADNTETGGSVITATPDDNLDAKVTNAGNSGVSTVRLQAGTYEQSVTVDVEGLTLEGAGADATTITGQSTRQQAALGIPGATNTNDVSGVTVRGLTIEAGSEERAVNVQTATVHTDLTFSDNTFVGDSGAAATVFIGGDSENVEVDDNTFTAAQGTVDKHLFLGGEATYGSADASATSQADAHTVTNNEFDSFSTTAVESEGQHAAIRQNTFTGAAGETQTAIAVPGPASSSANINAENYAITGNSFGAEIDTDVLVGPTVSGEVTSENGAIQNAPNGQAVIDGQLGTFNTVQGAVDAAGADATVFVGPGTFDESVDVNTDGLTLEGAGADATTITGQSTTQKAALNIPDVTTTNDVSGVTVRGLTIEAGSEERAVDVQTATVHTDLTFSDNTFVGNTGGVTAYIGGNSENVDFDGNTFDADGDSVNKHLFLEGNATQGSTGQSATSQANAHTVTDNTFNDYDTNAVEFEGQHGEIAGNTFNTDNSGSVAIDIPGPANFDSNIDANNIDIQNNVFNIPDGADDVDFGPTVENAPEE